VKPTEDLLNLPPPANKTDENVRPLTASLSKVDMTGHFKIKFSDPIYLLKEESIKAKNMLQISIIWINEVLFVRSDQVPAFNFNITEVTQYSIGIKLTFDDPGLISKG
jgi:hypothetical protein